MPSALYAIKQFVSIFLPEFNGASFESTKLRWYTDSLDNSFLIDYVPTYAENSIFVCKRLTSWQRYIPAPFQVATFEQPLL
ncbi:uncharacterized protein ASPGLDRAFT_52054 [Aspergillus glaucus CBS 516.65]|uniref:Uncharacterized protein n=1 Tax=Aspergillus glaucus CBS 516.65 TaxID=1160497 RepID=A0A1L9V7E6_ASPGL|nr:hypothetical protein ASPGLDRAFT_52054 [Aspergillus glaucus CBS 516.65]OJJ79836.1 hypothetical protein ASPGLDRAFT_52054 [Aspergillus glaucus CBS 516.65]